MWGETEQLRTQLNFTTSLYTTKDTDVPRAFTVSVSITKDPPHRRTHGDHMVTTYGRVFKQESVGVPVDFFVSIPEGALPRRFLHFVFTSFLFIPRRSQVLFPPVYPLSSFLFLVSHISFTALSDSTSTSFFDSVVGQSRDVLSVVVPTTLAFFLFHQVVLSSCFCLGPCLGSTIILAWFVSILVDTIAGQRIK